MFHKYWLPFAFAASLIASSAFATGDIQDGSRFEEELNESDFDALRDFVNTKRDIPLDEKSTSLVISGDVRSEWRHMTETGRKGGTFGAQHNLRGGEAVGYNDFPISRNDFDVEFNLYFKYTTERAWAVAQIQFDNSCGVFDNRKECPGQDADTTQGMISIIEDGQLDPDPFGWHGTGNCDDLCLKKAYVGYNVFNCGDSRFDIEIGRRRLYHAFDSNIQFCSQFDGILLHYSDKLEMVSSWYIKAAGFVVNERVNQFAWIAETGFLNIADSGFDLKYSFTDWQKHGRTQCFIYTPNGNKDWFRNPRGFNFLNSQVTVLYHLDPELLCRPATFFAAYLYNHAQRFARVPVLDANGQFNGDYDKIRANTGWYVGFKVGQVVKEGDFSFEAQYQYVGAVAVGDRDVRGIGRGNVLDESFTNKLRGNTNFKGWKFETLYALTDNFTVDACLEWSKAAKSSIGGSHHFSKFQLETIYAF